MTGRVCLTLAVFSLCSAPVRGEQSVEQPVMATHQQAIAWSPQTVRYPVTTKLSRFIDDLSIVDPTKPIPQSRDPVRLQPGKGLALELEALELVRVRMVEGKGPLSSVLRAVRLQAGQPSATALRAADRPVDARTSFLVQPPGPNGVWLLWASTPITVVVERPLPRPDRGGWENTRYDLLRWIEKDSAEVPTLPSRAGMTELASQLRDDLEYADWLKQLADASLNGKHSITIQQALLAWRKVTAVAALDRTIPHRSPVFRRDKYEDVLQQFASEPDLIELTPGNTAVSSTSPEATNDKKTTPENEGQFQIREGRPWHRLTQPASRVRLTATGPGVLEIEMRALWPIAVKGDATSVAAIDTLPERHMQLTVGTQNHTLANRTVTLGPARVHPQKRVLTAFSQRRPLLTATRQPVSYRASVQVTLYPGQHDYELNLSGGPALLRVSSVHRQPRFRAGWLESSTPEQLVEQTFVALAKLPQRNYMPVLAIRDELAETLGLPMVSNETQRKARPNDVRERIEHHKRPPVATSPDPLEWQSRLLAQTESAWRKHPMDAALRTRHRQQWREQTRWRLLTPGSSRSGVQRAPEPWRFVEIRPPAQNLMTTLQRNYLWPIPLGKHTRVRAPVSVFSSGRPALLRLYAKTPAQRPGPIHVRIGDHAMAAAAFSPIEMLEIALRPGDHELRVDAPTGSEVFSSLELVDGSVQGPKAGGKRAFARSMWPCAVQGDPLRIRIPQSPVAGPVRLRFRRLMASPIDGPTRLTLHTDVGQSRVLDLRLAQNDPTVIPIRAPGTLSTSAELVMYLPPTTREIWFTGKHAHAIAAAVAIRVGQAEQLPDIASATALATGGTNPPPVAQTRTAQAGPDLNAIHGASAAVATTPGDVSALIQRARVLLDSDQGGQARYDLLRLLRDPALAADPQQAKLRDALIEHFDAWLEPTHLRHAEMAGPAMGLRPAMTERRSWATLGSVLKIVRTARTRGVDQALKQLQSSTKPAPALLYTQARLLELAGENKQAAETYLRVARSEDLWQAALDAMAPLYTAVSQRNLDRKQVRALSALTARGYAAATAIETHVGHFMASRTLAATARLTRWVPVRRMAHTAGFERLFTTRALPDLTPNAQIRWAISAAPWAVSESHVARPGRGAAIDLRVDRPTRLRVQAWCARWRSQAPDPIDCPISFRLNNQTGDSKHARIGQITDLANIVLEPGRHRIEASHADSDDATLAVIRFDADRPLQQVGKRARNRNAKPGGERFSIPVVLPGRWYVARQSDPAHLWLMGPAVVRLQARRHGDLTPGTLHVSARRNVGENSEDDVGLRGPAEVESTLALPLDQDLAAVSDRKDSLVVSQLGEQVLILPETGRYQLTAQPNNGAAAFRVYIRRGRAGARVPGLPPPIGSGAVSDPHGYRLPVEPFVQAESLRPHSTPTWATLSLGLRAGREDFSERDNPDRRPADMATLELDWRRRLEPARTWLRAGLGARWHDQNVASTGNFDTGVLSTTAHARAHIRDLPGNLNLFGGGRVFYQPKTDRLPHAITAYGNVTVNRFFATGRTTGLLPALSFNTRYLTLNADDFAPPAIIINNRVPLPPTVDPLVYNRYGKEHPRTLTASLTGIWFAYQDQLGMTGVRAISNADVQSLDYVQAHLTWRGLIELAPSTKSMGVTDPAFELRYRPSWRFADDHRSDGFLRHDLGIRLGLSVWQGDSGRWFLELRNNVVLSNAASPRNTLIAGLRFDFARGRALRDLFPTEDDFAPLLGPSAWGPLP